MSLPRDSRPARRDPRRARRAETARRAGGRTDGRSRSPTTPAPRWSALGDEAYRRFSSDNALNTDAFPSLRRIQADVVAMTADLLDGGPEAAGFMTTGGTESLLMAVKAARERGRAERDITRPEHRVADERPRGVREGLPLLRPREPARRRVGDDWRADVDAMADVIDDDTVLVVGSAPQYPQGVIDPIPDDRRPRRRPPASTVTSTRAWAGWCSPTWRASARRSRRGTSRCRA